MIRFLIGCAAIAALFTVLGGIESLVGWWIDRDLKRADWRLDRD